MINIGKLRISNYSWAFFPLWLLWLLFWAFQASAATESQAGGPDDAKVDTKALSINGYLKQVTDSNIGYKAALTSQAGAEDQFFEGRLITMPQVFGNLQYSDDKRLGPNSALYGNETKVTAISLGVSEATSFGLSGKIYYNLNTVSVLGVNPMILQLAPNLPIAAYTQTGMNLELTFSLLKNGFGVATKATIEAQESQALASSYGAAFQRKVTLSDAELRYWRLAIAREIIKVQRSSLERAKQLRDYHIRRVKLNLAEEADLLQSLAGVKARELDLKSGLIEESSAIRAFNAARNRNNDIVSEKLELPDQTALEAIEVPKRSEKREDVLSAEQASKAAIANYTRAQDQELPAVDLFANLSTSGYQGSLGGAISDSLSTSYPFGVIGVRVSAPLDFTGAARARTGYSKAAIAAELDFQKKVFEQEVTWNDLVQQLISAKEKLKLVVLHEEAQHTKLELERKRQKQGQSTTYQVYLFENEYLGSQLARIQTQAAILSLSAQLKTFLADARGAS